MCARRADCMFQGACQGIDGLCPLLPAPACLPMVIAARRGRSAALLFPGGQGGDELF